MAIKPPADFTKHFAAGDIIDVDPDALAFRVGHGATGLPLNAKPGRYRVLEVSPLSMRITPARLSQTKALELLTRTMGS